MMMYVLVLVLLIGFQYLYFKIAKKYGLVDVPNGRSSHTKATLIGGGAVFFVAAIMYFGLIDLTHKWFVAGLILLSVISFWDDIKNLSPRLRFIIQLVSITFLFIDLSIFQVVPLLAFVLIYVFAVGLLNAYNFMDGINGLTGGMNLLLVGVLIFINQVVVEFVDIQLLVFLLFALFIFNFTNFRKKAMCFSGDVGAFSLGFIVLFLMCKLILQTGNFAYIGLLTVYGIDSALTIIHRIILRERILTPHRRHLFQILVNEGSMTHLSVSGVYIVVQLVINVVLLYFINISPLMGYVFFASFLILLSMVYVFLKFQMYRKLKTQKIPVGNSIDSHSSPQLP